MFSRILVEMDKITKVMKSKFTCFLLSLRWILELLNG